MASLTSLVKMDPTRGLLGDAVQGIGVGTLANVADKKLLQGKLTAAGVGLGQTINGKPLTINLTDALTWFIISKGKIRISSRELMTILGTIGVKKVFEAFDYIDPPTPLASADPRATNVTMARQNREQAPAAPRYAAMPNYW